MMLVFIKTALASMLLLWGQQQVVMPKEADVRLAIREAYLRDVGVREATGRNDGVQVEAYQRHVGIPKGSPWCVAFVSFKLWEGVGDCIIKFGVPDSLADRVRAMVLDPKSGWSPVYAVHGRTIYDKGVFSDDVKPGMVFTIYFNKMKRVGHGGFADELLGDFVQTVEGNTSPAGSREGDGVYQRLRHFLTIYRINDFVVI